MNEVARGALLEALAEVGLSPCGPDCAMAAHEWSCHCIDRSKPSEIRRIARALAAALRSHYE